LFPQEERGLARQTFAHSLKAVISQSLLPGLKEEMPRVPAVEILITTSVIKNLIVEGQEAEIAGIIKTSLSDGMQDFTESLRSLVESGLIDLKIAFQHASNVEDLKMTLKGIKARG
jgi:Tfp pilus assembly pilus retraction ATPase PilT